MNKADTIMYIVFHILINYYEFICCIENIVDPDQLVSGYWSDDERIWHIVILFILY